MELEFADAMSFVKRLTNSKLLAKATCKLERYIYEKESKDP